jgi:hypothetical protein
LTQVTQQGQTGGNSVAAKLVNFTYDHDGNVLTVSRYANLAATQLNKVPPKTRALFGQFGQNAVDGAAVYCSTPRQGTTQHLGVIWEF